MNTNVVFFVNICMAAILDFKMLAINICVTIYIYKPYIFRVNESINNKLLIVLVDLVRATILNKKRPPIKSCFTHISVCEAHLDVMLVSIQVSRKPILAILIRLSNLAKAGIFLYTTVA
jgi:hypothetical protein